MRYTALQNLNIDRHSVSFTLHNDVPASPQTSPNVFQAPIDITQVHGQDLRASYQKVKQRGQGTRRCILIATTATIWHFCTRCCPGQGWQTVSLPPRSLVNRKTPLTHSFQLPHLHLLLRLACDDEEKHQPPILLLLLSLNHHPSPPTRLSPRRRHPRQSHLDPPPLHLRQLPSPRQRPTTIRHANLPIHILQDLPLLGMCGRFPGLDDKEWE